MATLVVWHHLVLYGPLAYDVTITPGGVLDRLQRYRWAVQVFFIISGYVLARTMSPRVWTVRHVGWFAVRRYVRLGIPYLAAIGLSVTACAVARALFAFSCISPRRPDSPASVPPAPPR